MKLDDRALMPGDPTGGRDDEDLPWTNHPCHGWDDGSIRGPRIDSNCSLAGLESKVFGHRSD